VIKEVPARRGCKEKKPWVLRIEREKKESSFFAQTASGRKKGEGGRSIGNGSSIADRGPISSPQRGRGPRRTRKNLSGQRPFIINKRVGTAMKEIDRREKLPPPNCQKAWGVLSPRGGEKLGEPETEGGRAGNKEKSRGRERLQGRATHRLKKHMAEGNIRGGEGGLIAQERQ